MTALEIVQNLIAPIWKLFTDVTVPGLGVSCGTLLLAVFGIKLSITLLRAAFGIGGGTGYRSGQSRNPKISDERKGDEL